MNNWMIILVTLVLSAFFSGMEIAFVSSNKLKIELDRQRGLISAKVLSRFVQSSSDFIGALLLGNNVALVIYGIAIALILEPAIISYLPAHLESELLILLLQTVISTIIILIVAEFLPKVFFRIYSNTILNIFAIPIAILFYIFYPINYLFIGISEFILKNLFRVRFKEESSKFTSVDLDNFIKEFHNSDMDEGDIQSEIQMFQNAIEFKSVKLRECMVPRPEIVALEENETIEELRQLFIESGHSKILVFNESIDNIEGYVHHFDMYRRPRDIQSIVKPLLFAPETMLANEILTRFIKENRSIAIVVDEFGGTSGMVTLEDIIEEIFGEIEDEYDTEEQVEVQKNELEYIFSGRLEIDYLNDKYKLDLPTSDDYETLAGLIINHHESIPELDEEITINSFRFIILEASENRIEKVLLKLEK
ncbi:MAG: hemolysin family protein [Bacteroidales bacterium]|nr:hemolysin family protein [Bacteroidales bacterium]